RQERILPPPAGTPAHNLCCSGRHCARIISALRGNIGRIGPSGATASAAVDPDADPLAAADASGAAGAVVVRTALGLSALEQSRGEKSLLMAALVPVSMIDRARRPKRRPAAAGPPQRVPRGWMLVPRSR